jgi:hypothetical protein
MKKFICIFLLFFGFLFGDAISVLETDISAINVGWMAEKMTR